MLVTVMTTSVLAKGNGKKSGNDDPGQTQEPESKEEVAEGTLSAETLKAASPANPAAVSADSYISDYTEPAPITNAWQIVSGEFSGNSHEDNPFDDAAGIINKSFCPAEAQ